MEIKIRCRSEKICLRARRVRMVCKNTWGSCTAAFVYGLSTVSLRYFNVYGPGASYEGAYALVVAKFIQQRLDGASLTITGDGSQTRDFTHVSDVVRANLLAARSPRVGRGEVINIGSGC